MCCTTSRSSTLRPASPSVSATPAPTRAPHRVLTISCAPCVPRVALGARITGVDDTTFSSTGESFSMIVLPQSSSANERTLQSDDVSLAYEFAKKVCHLPPRSCLRRAHCLFRCSRACRCVRSFRATRATTSARVSVCNDPNTIVPCRAALSQLLTIRCNVCDHRGCPRGVPASLRARRGRPPACL